MTLRMRIDNFDTLEDGGPTWISLDQRGASVGRRTSMDWVLPDPAKHVSSHHFDIQYADGAYWVRDVSTNGTYLQGSHYRIDGPVQLRGGERLIVGHYVIAVDLSVPQGAAAPARPEVVHTIDPWGNVSNDADPWDLSGEELSPVDPLPPPASNPHHLDEMAQDFVPLQQPAPPSQMQAAPLQAPDMQPPPGDRVQHPPMPSDAAPQSPVPKQVPMPPIGNPSETVVQPPPARTAAAPQAAEPVAAAGPDRQAILAAFCRGAGLPETAAQDVDPLELVEALGRSARVTVDEIMAMLKDRASVKQFTRGGERTMRSATGNNPMKFLPDAEQAFAALFLHPREGFMKGPEGFESALGDLRRHQAAVFAALQPALADVLSGLSPDEIGEREGTSNNLLGGSRRTRNWEAFVKRWDEKASAGDHGMLDVFLRAFARAYAEAAAKSGPA